MSQCMLVTSAWPDHCLNKVKSLSKAEETWKRKQNRFDDSFGCRKFVRKHLRISP